MDEWAEQNGLIEQIDLSVNAKRLFEPYKPLGVVFMDLGDNPEGAVDEGGPTREFCRLLMKDIQSRSLFEGPDNSKLLALDSHAISKGDYKLIGKMISICLIDGGVAPHFFAPQLFSLVVREATEDVDLTEIVDEGFRSQLQKACNQPILSFIHTDRKFPEANTCDIVLCLPIHRTYEEFCNHMCSGILQATEFGMT
ncbi:unnamed protein product [Leuciscus chuanchicus]